MTVGAGRVLTRDELRALFEGAIESVCRLEAQQIYDAPGETERIEVFLAGRDGWQRPPDDESLRMIHETTAQGVAWSRVHVIEEPLTDYLRFELAAYHENEAAGEAVWIASRATYPAFASLTEDFVIIDDRIGVLFRYDQHGWLLGYERIADEDLDHYRRCRDLAFAHAVRLVDYHVAT